VQQASEKEEGKERRRKIYRYTLSLTNPFPGSERSYVTGHHGVDNHFQFLNLLERYPRRRNDFTAKQAIEMARRWIIFSNGKEPWGEYIRQRRMDREKIAVCDDIRGWTERTREVGSVRLSSDISAVTASYPSQKAEKGTPFRPCRSQDS